MTEVSGREPPRLLRPCICQCRGSSSRARVQDCDASNNIGSCLNYLDVILKWCPRWSQPERVSNYCNWYVYWEIIYLLIVIPW